MREDHIFLLNKLWCHLAKSLVLLSELLLAFWGGGIHTESNRLVLVGVGEGEENSISLTLVVSLSQVTLLSSPGKLWGLVVEHAGSLSSKNSFQSEPLEWVWLLTSLVVGHWSHFSFQVVHGVIPSLTRVGIELPLLMVLGLGPVWNSESLEDSSSSSVEGNVTDTLGKGVWVEVLSVDVMHDCWLFVEFVGIGVLDSHA